MHALPVDLGILRMLHARAQVRVARLAREGREQDAGRKKQELSKAQQEKARIAWQRQLSLNEEVWRGSRIRTAGVEEVWRGSRIRTARVHPRQGSRSILGRDPSAPRQGSQSVLLFRIRRSTYWHPDCGQQAPWGWQTRRASEMAGSSVRTTRGACRGLEGC